jgi:hypothetical protein
MKPTVYIETTIVSYLTSRPSRDIIAAGRQRITHDWWDSVRPQCDCFISAFVLKEARQGDSSAVQKRIEAVATLRILEETADVDRLARIYFATLGISDKARTDSEHLAMATIHQMDYMLTWNLQHLANVVIKRKIAELNKRLDIHTPTICTPEELMEV